jgi:hypothetical protein
MHWMMMHPMVVLILLLVSPLHRLRCTLAVHEGVCDFGNVYVLLDMIFRAWPAVGFYVLYHPLSLVESMRTCAMLALVAVVHRSRKTRCGVSKTYAEST